ncbi:GNAT family N-acetyltransferase [Candidatus Pacearchaeota archaeon]|nr:GNAT family N-acetyltransferase [Candidatus Pacearchaeota archaeon]
MMIREAIKTDIEDVVSLGTSFFEEAKTDLTPNFSQEKASAVISGMVENEGCILYVAEDDDGDIVGMIGVIVSEHWFSDETVAQELFWYVLPDFRQGVGSELLSAMESKVKERGVSLIAMVDLGDKSPVDVLLRRRGYSIHEKTYVRRI